MDWAATSYYWAVKGLKLLPNGISRLKLEECVATTPPENYNGWVITDIKASNIHDMWDCQPSDSMEASQLTAFVTSLRREMVSDPSRVENESQDGQLME